MTKTSIVILTYNSDRFIGRLINSIKDSNSQDLEIIIVDNASTDNTVKEVRKFEKNIKLIENRQNLGFSKGINIGAGQAQGEYLLFVNPDAELREGNISSMLRVFEENENAGIVGGRLVDKDGKEEKSAGKFFGLFQIILLSLGLDEAMGVRFSPRKIQKVDFVSGGFMMVRKDLFEKLGGFDENLFMYVEDMELCYRAGKAGFFTYFTPDVVLTHEAHGSSNRGFAVKNIYRGILYFHKKHGTPFSYFLIRLLLVAKASTLVLIGKTMNNKYLRDTYSEALKI